MFKTSFAALGTVTLLCSTALAGPCADRIAQMEKAQSATDAGSGPTKPATGASGDVAAAPSAAAPAGQAPGTGGTAAMSAAVGNKATSPADVRAQQQGQASASQGATSSGMQNASGEFSRAMRDAKTADQKGDVAACNRSLDEAQRYLKS